MQRGSRTATRRLWGDGHGSFTTSGRFAAAVVVGTRWLTTDTCDGTQIYVAQGPVDVTNLVTHRIVAVTSGETYGTGPTGSSSSISITTTRAAPMPGQSYTVTAAGSAGGSGTVYLLEDSSSDCSATLEGERANGAAVERAFKPLPTYGPFTLSTTVTARYAGTAHWCGYVTNPAASAEIDVRTS